MTTECYYVLILNIITVMLSSVLHLYIVDFVIFTKLIEVIIIIYRKSKNNAQYYHKLEALKFNLLVFKVMVPTPLLSK